MNFKNLEYSLNLKHLRNFKNLLFLFFLIISLAACNEVEVEKGELPLEVIQHVKPHLGRYNGVMNGKSTEITLILLGATPTLKIKNTEGNDLLAKHCGSAVGRLLAFTGEVIGSARYELESASFAFDPGLCSLIEGRTLTIEFRTPSTFDLSIIKKDTRSTVCPPSAGRSVSADTQSVIPACTELGTLSYLRGHFSQ